MSRLTSIVLTMALIMSSTIALIDFAPPSMARDWGDATYDVVDGREGDKFEANYRENAQVWLKPEQRLANGVSWRLLVDARTGMRMPRITWMPNRASLAAANKLFDRVHGAAIAEADDIEERWRKIYEVYDEVRASHRVFRFEDFIMQTDVALTYASDRFVSYREFGRIIWDERDEELLSKGQVFDLVRGTSSASRPVRGGAAIRRIRRLGKLRQLGASRAHVCPTRRGSPSLRLWRPAPAVRRGALSAVPGAHRPMGVGRDDDRRQESSSKRSAVQPLGTLAAGL